MYGDNRAESSSGNELHDGDTSDNADDVLSDAGFISDKPSILLVRVELDRQ